MESETAKLVINSQEYQLPVITGTENEKGIDISSLRATSNGYITLDPGYANTGSCQSDITFIDGEKGILRYRGYPVDQLAQNASFPEVASLLIHGELPTAQQLATFSSNIEEQLQIPKQLENFTSSVLPDAAPMMLFSALMNCLGTYHPKMTQNITEEDHKHFDEATSILLSQSRTLAALIFRHSQNAKLEYPSDNSHYAGTFLKMMFPEKDFPEEIRNVLDLIFILHADHEQNCSTSSVRMVGSGGANIFTGVSTGVSALSGPLHGGANTAVIKMLEAIHASGDDGSNFVEKAKNGKARLMGFGHRVYKNYDPRAKLMRTACEKVFNLLNVNDPLLDIAEKLEQRALSDDYFVERKLYPNVDFYSGIIFKAIGIPASMFTIMFAIGRLPGWIAQWNEVVMGPSKKIHRPRQIYVGPKERNFVPMENR